jgi:protein involved in polysaccharide export with SLBB domain
MLKCNLGRYLNPRTLRISGWAFWLAGLIFTSIPAAATSQTTPSPDAGRPQISRAELEVLLRQLESQSGSSSGGQAKAQAELIRRRLQEGDFQVGDQIEITIEGEEKIPTLTVDAGRRLTIPDLGGLSLQGVLRSELERKVLEHVSRYIQNPVVRATSLLRIAVIGQVGKPGFHSVPAQTALPEAIMTAGGPTATAKFENIRIQRMGERIWEGTQLRQALADGRTLDQLSLRSGDEIIVPGKTESSFGRVGRVLTFALPVAITVATLILR